MSLNKIIFFLISIIFCWSVSSHALSCAGEELRHSPASQSLEFKNASHPLQTNHPITASSKSAPSCELDCSSLHVLLFTSCLETHFFVGIQDSLFSGHPFLYQQPNLGSQIIPPIQVLV